MLMKRRLLSTPIAIGMFLVFGSGAFAQCSSPLACYLFNGNLNDISGNNYNGTNMGGAIFTTDRFNQTNSALMLSGANSQYISLPSAITFSLDISISFWVQTTTVNNNTWPFDMFVIDRDIC